MEVPLSLSRYMPRGSAPIFANHMGSMLLTPTLETWLIASYRGKILPDPLDRLEISFATTRPTIE